ncbi:putative gustatory receptor 28a [Temnothorax curvispinosus]|uniref:Gustatory receptor n=1 Tax=Temnothorax curvispinosus TaxID=300111 RepID=A0A6J1QRQ3_9HYME|nr:putative gustatory receptor 28a [Temnothorax curvispinosus]
MSVDAFVKQNLKATLQKLALKYNGLLFLDSVIYGINRRIHISLIMSSSSTKFQGHAKYKIWKKWQLFHATDFQSLMYPCFTFCSVLGIFPYKINGSTFETSKQRYILSTAILCILCIYELIVLYEIDIAGTIRFKGVPKTLERNCFYILSSFIAIVTYILSGPRMHLLQTIMNVSSKLPLNSYQKLSRLIHTKDIVGFSFLVTHAIFYYSTLDFDTWHKAFVPYITLLAFQMDMLYMNCVCILKACFKEINDNLSKLRELVVNDEPQLVRHIYHEHRNQNPFLLLELKALKKHHLVVSDTVQILNMIFSLQILTTIVMTFAEITFLLYFYILHWKVGTLLSNLNPELYDTALVLSIIYYSIKIVLIGWACDTGKDQATRIGTTIHEILNSTIDKQIKDELQLFSLQVLHRDNTFSAKGLTIDSTLLVAIVGNITTYLLILIQFLVAEQI